MTDTLITVDVSSAALVSRAREGQAVARENLLRVERERQERKKQEKARRERLDREQADRLGRSRLRKGGRREEVAAGYVAPTEFAHGYLSETATYDPDSQTTTRTWKAWSGDGMDFAETAFREEGLISGVGPSVSSPYVSSEDSPPPGPQGGVYEQRDNIITSIVLPVGGKDMLLVAGTRTYLYSTSWSWTWNPGYFTPSGFYVRPRWTYDPVGSVIGDTTITRSYLISKNKSRETQTPDTLNDYMRDHGYRIDGLDDLLEPDFPQGMSQGLGATGANSIAGVWENTGTPRSIEAIVNPDAASWSSTWYQFSSPTSNPAQYVPRRITQLNSTTKEPLDSESGQPVQRFAIPSSIPNQSLADGTALTTLIAWDWGKPQLCRRLLLQLGFRPEDLRP